MRTKTWNSKSPALKWTALALLAGSLLVPGRAEAGSWTPLVRTAPDSVVLMLLLSDGTVFAANGYTSSGQYGSNCFRLTPDSHGSYVNGTWTTLAPMHDTRLWYSSDVLRDGRIFVAGGEYGTRSGTNAEVYDPLANNWTPTPPAGVGFGDSGSKVLANGNVLVSPVGWAPFAPFVSMIYNPTLNSWAVSPPSSHGYQDEASWVKLPDDSILTVDDSSTSSERFIPSLNQWIPDANVPVALYDPYGGEMGAGFLLPDGRAFYLGASGHTALYTPSGNTNHGVWVQGPDIPNAQGTPDAGAAMMVNGKILCAVSPLPVSTNHFPSPTSFYEYDYTVGPTGSFTQVASPTGGLTDNISSYQAVMLDLPDGTVLYSHFNGQLYVYQPGGTPLASGKPAVYGITWNPDGSLHLTGTLFNGISQGAAYGDDAQMDSNYPLVRFTDGSGNVSYWRTYNWSSTGVQTGGQIVSTECAEPSTVFSGPGGVYSVQVVANGIASDPASFYGPVWVDFNFSGPFQFGSYSFPYSTLASGVSAVASGGTIAIKPGASHETMTISKPMTITAIGGGATIGH